MSEGPGRNPRHEHIGAMPRSSFVAPPHIKDFFYRYSGMARSLSVGVSAGLYRYLQLSPQARAFVELIKPDLFSRSSYYESGDSER